MIYLDLARPMDAEQRLAEARSVNPRQPAVRVELGRAALAQGDYKRAVDHLTSALALNPELTAIHYPLGMAYRGLGELEKAAEHLEQRVSSTSRRAMTEIPIPDPLVAALNGIVQTPQLYRERGLDAAATGNWAEAVKNFRLAVDADPGHAGMRVNLAAALERVGDARGALEQYQQALRLDPDLAEAHFGLADLLERGGREQEALEAFKAAVAANPNFIAAQLRLADALRRTDQLEESLPHYRQVIALEPADLAARFGEAMALVRLARYAEARDRLAEGLTVHPDQPIFRQALARILAAAPDDRVRDGERAWKLVEGDFKGAEPPRRVRDAGDGARRTGSFRPRARLAAPGDVGGGTRRPARRRAENGGQPGPLRSAPAVPRAVAGRRSGPQARPPGEPETLRSRPRVQLLGWIRTGVQKKIKILALP